MARLIFYDDTHTYEVDGEIFPSVSEISRFASREIYGDVSQYALDNAASRGSLVHKYTEVLDKYGSCECEEDVQEYIKAYLKFRKDFKISEYLFIEKALANEKLKYAGTIDRIYKMDENFINAVNEKCKKYFVCENGKLKKLNKVPEMKQGDLAIIDLKSSYSVQNILAMIQLNAYKLNAEQNKLGEVGALFILHLDKNGDYELIGYQIEPKIFLACLTLHNIFNKNKNKKETENG